MPRPSVRARLAAALVAVGGVTAATLAGVAPAGAAPAHPALPAARPGAVAAACSTPAAGRAACLARFVAAGGVTAGGVTAGGVTAGAAPAPVTGLTPADIASAYALGGTGSGLVAIVDAYDNPKAEADLAVYRKRFGLPACTTANGCFRKVNQRGTASPLPEGDPGWGLEIALDLDAVSAACPRCSVLLVEGDDSSLVSLGKAVNTAVRLGAAVVSNSYGTDGEFAQMATLGARYYDHPGVPIVASSGDVGFTAASFPAVSSTVIGVGGTTLRPNTSARGWGEKVWAGGGSGCSAYIAKPAFQRGTGDHCRMRTVADVSAVADPRTGLATYDTYGTEQDTTTGWLQVGGTSLSSPLVAAMITRAGHTTRYDDASGLYARAAAFHDVVSGSNGFCGGDYLCTGLPGYDAPTGIGTPNGLAGL